MKYEFDLSKALEQKEVAVSKVKLTVLDRRSLEQTRLEKYVFGEFYNDSNDRLLLNQMWFDLVNSELIDTQYGQFSLKGIFDAFVVAGANHD